MTPLGYSHENYGTGNTIENIQAYINSSDNIVLTIFFTDGQQQIEIPLDSSILQSLDNSIRPTTDNVLTIGTSDKRFSDMYCINLHAYNINNSLLPSETNVHDLGASDKKFANIYMTNLYATNINDTLLPSETNVHDLGASDKKFANVYFTNLNATNINDTLLPSVTNVHDLGSTSKKFANGYFTNLHTDDLIYDGEVTFSTVNTNEIVSDDQLDIKYGASTRASMLLSSWILYGDITTTGRLFAPQNPDLSNPSYSFGANPDSGFHYYLNKLHMIINSTDYLTITESTISTVNQILGQDGIVSAPAYSFTNSTDTGLFYSSGSEYLGLIYDGSYSFKVRSDRAETSVLRALTKLECAAIDNHVDDSAITITSDLGIVVTNGVHVWGEVDPLDDNTYDLGNSTNAWKDLYIAGNIYASSGRILHANGSGSYPSYSFTNHSTSGMFINSTELALAYGGTKILEVNADGINSVGRVLCQNGTEGAPGFSFSAGDSNGMYKTSDSVGLSMGGNVAIEMKATKIYMRSPTQILGNCMPEFNDAYDLGHTSQKWQDLYLSGIAYVPAGSAASPTINFTNTTGTGVYSGGALLYDVAVGGTRKFEIGTSGAQFWTGFVKFNGDITPGTDDTLILDLDRLGGMIFMQRIT